MGVASPPTRRPTPVRCAAPQPADSLLARWLPSPPELNGMPARSWSPASLAFIGDAVWEVCGRLIGFGGLVGMVSAALRVPLEWGVR